MKKRVLGVDVGRVIIAPGAGAGDTSFIGGSEEAAMRTPEMPGCFDALARLCERFERRVWIVSKAGPRVAARTMRWFEHQRFFARTGICPEQVRFCRERAQKRDHCVEHHITYFVDDRCDVLDNLRGVVPGLFLFGATRAPTGMRAVPSWQAAQRAIVSALESRDMRTAPTR
jgi:hypothetical protein